MYVYYNHIHEKEKCFIDVLVPLGKITVLYEIVLQIIMSVFVLLPFIETREKERIEEW